jgi:hypothetical protein
MQNPKKIIQLCETCKIKQPKLQSIHVHNLNIYIVEREEFEPLKLVFPIQLTCKISSQFSQHIIF